MPLAASAASAPADAPRKPEGPSPDFNLERGKYPVKLDALRARIPANLYWKLGAPTSDPGLLAERAKLEQKARVAKGRISAGDASEEEIRKYFEEQRRISEDSLAFAQEVLAQYGAQLSDRDRGLYELAARMHATRLAEMDRRIEDALARKRLQDKRRAAWEAAGKPALPPAP